MTLVGYIYYCGTAKNVWAEKPKVTKGNFSHAENVLF